ncbi:MAG: aldolase [Acidobacteria bacterium]|jgi:superfamily II DNA helicase RecQ|nr:aldolase [Acidobacteriota bacterium]
MKCKVFKIHLDEDARNFEEVKLNKFLESVKVSQTFASAINNEFWSILVFYEDANSSNQNATKTAVEPQKIVSTETAGETAKSAPEPIAATPEQEERFNRLKLWRNERAALDGLPPYMIAQNDSLMQIAVSDVKTPEDLISIKGFGEKRAQKYGEQIIEVLTK